MFWQEKMIDRFRNSCYPVTARGDCLKRERVFLSEVQGTFGTIKNGGIQHLFAVLESSFDGIFITDREACPIWCNHSYEVISGLKEDDVLGIPMEKLVAQGIISNSSTLMALEKGETVTIDQTFKTGKHAVVTSTPIYDDDNAVCMVVTNVRDISELISLQETLDKQKRLSAHYEQEVAVIRNHIMNTPQLVAEDPVTLNLLRIVSRAALLDTVVLIQGETGSGKEVVASYIHRQSPRAQKNFVRVNCGAIPENLAESELFGYERGAFTGANREGKAGLFEAANGGTIFLDEIGELSLHIQTKLLRALQEREITRVGGSKPIKVDVRVIAATNRDLKKEVEAGTFREDLYYRLSVFPVWVPPLRERKLDILKLSSEMLKDLNERYGRRKSLTSRAEGALTQYDWPGNVRELRNVMERAFIMSDDDEISAEDLAIMDQGQLHTPHAISLTFGMSPVSKEEETPVLVEGESLQKQVERFEAKLIGEALEKEGSLRGAARRLKMDPATLLRRKKKYEDAGLLAAE